MKFLNIYFNIIYTYIKDLYIKEIALILLVYQLYIFIKKQLYKVSFHNTIILQRIIPKQKALVFVEFE